MSDDEFIDNNHLEIPESVPHFGTLLRELRDNHGYSIPQLSKRISLPVRSISAIELGNQDLPIEPILRSWLRALGCNTVTVNKIVRISRQFKIKHWIKLDRNETANTDLLRLLEAYRNKELTDYDRTLMFLLCRKPNNG